MKDFEKFIDGFRNFRRFYFDAENDYYTSLNKGQHPKAIVIACSDSRADPALLMGCDPGDIFVVRNVANLVPHADDALRRDAVLAVLEYGVHHLKVEHIIVLGHSGCGGIQALLNPESLHDESFVANWVSMAAPALERMRDDVRDESPADRQRHCEEAAILVSIDNLLSYPWIQERVAAHKLSLHAWYFDMSQGSLLAYFPDSETYRRFLAPLADGRMEVPAHIQKDSPLGRELPVNVKMLIENRKENTALRIKACLYGVMDALCKAATPARHPAGAEHRDTRLLRQTVQYVDRHYAEKITVAAISAQCGYSSSHFMKRFHDLTGTSFAQYLIHFRLEKAATLLRGSRYTVLEIAARCGFSNASYFTRAFTRQYGVSPTAYRQGGDRTDD